MTRHGATYAGTSGIGRTATLRRTWQIAMVLARSDLKQRYFGSALGALWTLIRPLLLFGVLYVVFSNILPLGGDIENYPLYLLTSLSMWGAFSEIASSCLNSMVTRSGVLQKISIPVISIPLGEAIGAVVQFGATLVVVLAFLLASGTPITAGWLFLPVAAVMVIALGWGAGLLLSIMYAKYRDIGPIWEVFSSLMFWATPIIYVSSQPIKPSLKQVLGLNPLAPIFTETRHFVIDTTAPSATEVFHTPILIASGAIYLTTIAAGFLIFNRFKDRVIEFL